MHTVYLAMCMHRHIHEYAHILYTHLHLHTHTHTHTHTLTHTHTHMHTHTQTHTHTHMYTNASVPVYIYVCCSIRYKKYYTNTSHTLRLTCADLSTCTLQHLRENEASVMKSMPQFSSRVQYTRGDQWRF